MHADVLFPVRTTAIPARRHHNTPQPLRPLPFLRYVFDSAEVGRALSVPAISKYLAFQASYARSQQVWRPGEAAAADEIHIAI